MSTSLAATWRPRVTLCLSAGVFALPLAFLTAGGAGASPLLMRSHATAIPNLHHIAQPYGARVLHSGSNNVSFCNRLWTDNSARPPAGAVWGSSGAQMYCFGPQFNQGNGGSARQNARINLSAITIGNNVDAANPNEDITPSGVRVYGQSETSSAAIDNFVVESWNDATGFYAPCGSPNNKEELSGYSFSTSNGASFKDLGGLPNSGCASSQYFGDTGVEAFRARNGSDYFYVSNIFITSTENTIALAACKVNGVGAAAFLTCSQPDVVAAISNKTGAPGSGFLDKPFLAIDQRRGLLYVSYTNYKSGPTDTGAGQIELATCNLDRSPGFPACRTTAIVAPEGSCVNQGSYPAADPATGDVYVAYEFNYVSNAGTPGCTSLPTQEVTARVPLSAARPVSAAGVSIVSEELASIPGYSRFPVPDFPRIAVSDPAGTVSIVWNDTRYRPTGDILLQSYALGSGFPTAVQTQPGCTSGTCPNPVRLTNNTTPTFNLLPALRNAEPDGNIDVTWYDRRRSPPTDRSFTDVFGALDINPRLAHTPANTRITNVGNSWLGTSSDINPNFGDYTDNHVKESGSGPTYTVNSLFVAWSDGRIGEPQPFSALVSGI